jgi:hypothetical protein
MAGGLQLVQATFSIRQPDANGILAEKDDGQNGRLRPQIQPQGLRPEMEGTWGSGHIPPPIGNDISIEIF